MSSQQTPRRAVMSISDRLDEIRDRYVEWHQDRGDHTPAPDTETWVDADHPDESMEHCIVRNDVPALVAALRAVLDLCDSTPLRYRPYNGAEPFMVLGVPAIRSAVKDALGEES